MKRLLLFSATLLICMNSFAQWPPSEGIQVKRLNVLNGLRIPVTTSKISPWADRDSIAQVTFDPTQLKFFGRFTTTSFKALASEDSVQKRWDSTKVKNYVSSVTGGGSSLQVTTGVGNTTANTIAVTGINKFADSTGTHIWNGELLFGNPVSGTYSSGFIEASSLSMSMTNSLNIDVTNTINIRSNGAGQVVNIRGLGGVNIGITGGTPTTFLGRAAGQKAIFSNEYVRKDQIDSFSSKASVKTLQKYMTDQGNTSTTPATYNALYTYNIGASQLGVNGDEIVASYSGRTAANNNAKGLQFFISGQGLVANIFSANNGSWTLHVRMIRTAVNAARVVTEFISPGLTETYEQDLISIDFTTSMPFALWGTSGAGAVNDVVAKMASIKFESNAP